MPVRRQACVPVDPRLRCHDAVLRVAVQDLWEETDNHSCLKPCVCPADGSACAPAAACDATHFSCKAGWRRFSDGQAKCFQPGCQAGSLHEAVGRSVANGQSYAVCTCTGALNAPLLHLPLCVESSASVQSVSLVGLGSLCRKA